MVASPVCPDVNVVWYTPKFVRLKNKARAVFKLYFKAVALPRCKTGMLSCFLRFYPVRKGGF